MNCHGNTFHNLWPISSPYGKKNRFNFFPVGLSLCNFISCAVFLCVSCISGETGTKKICLSWFKMERCKICLEFMTGWSKLVRSLISAFGSAHFNEATFASTHGFAYALKRWISDALIWLLLYQSGELESCSCLCSEMKQLCRRTYVTSDCLS